MSQHSLHPFDTTSLFPQLETSSPGAAKRTLFGAMTCIDYYDLDAI